MSGENGNSISSTFATVRLDLATKLAVLSSLLYSAAPSGYTLEDAVTDAVRLNDLCDIKAKQLKRAVA